MTATYTRIKTTGLWGVRGPDFLSRGDVVEVATKGGATKWATLGRKVWTDGDTAIFAIDLTAPHNPIA